jgi:hypothetical protein
MHNKNKNKLKPLLSETVTEKLKEILISRLDDGSYSLFNRYLITVTNDLYIVKIVNDEELISPVFSSLRYAVTWCTLEQRKKLKEIKRLEELDSLIGSLEIEIEMLSRRILRTADIDDKSIHLAKFYEQKRKKKLLQTEIDLLVQDSKYWQNKKFEETQSQSETLKQTDKYSNKEWKTYHET